MHFLIGLASLIGLITIAFGSRAAVVFAQIILIVAGSGAAFVAYNIFMRLQ